MVKSDLENTHREKHFVHGAVTAGRLYFSLAVQDTTIQGCAMRKGNRRARSTRKEHFITDEQ